ncbi:unnamed protein product, partial [marine sediment metagenome]
MFNIRIGDTQFKTYLLLDANEVMIKIHGAMKLLSAKTAYKTFITNIEKYEKRNGSSDEFAVVDTYTLTILMSPRYLTTNEIAALFKQAYE